ncbi:MAG: M23 family metallopeptidase, partial [Caldilineaceae bacterium]|nr:M23 family metallopeptidase [Caldilineaceae bacterium]
MVRRLRSPRLWRRLVWVLLVGLLFLVTFAVWQWQQTEETPQIQRLLTWLYNPREHADWSLQVGQRCGDAPMLLPTNGYVGFGWDDSFRPGHRHSGLDIFGPDPENGVTPIVAAYDGYLTREEGWKSTVIIRHPDFPAVPAAGIAAGEEIWTYYTHMASRDGTESYVAANFPPDTHEVFVEAGTLLGYQGNWGGSLFQMTGRHLHFSVVKSDEFGDYL